MVQDLKPDQRHLEFPQLNPSPFRLGRVSLPTGRQGWGWTIQMPLLPLHPNYKVGEVLILPTQPIEIFQKDHLWKSGFDLSYFVKLINEYFL
jgi:hypothetical protein